MDGDGVDRKSRGTPLLIRSSMQSAIILLALSNDGNYMAVVTGEDKLVHVLYANGLQHLSQRAMPKRPSAIAFSPDDQYILCGDKFGDVYALPRDPPVEPANTGLAQQPSKPSAPAATDLTVHSGRNLKALEHQKKQLKEKGAAAKSNEKPANKQEPVLGHVSMLTNLISVRREIRVKTGAATETDAEERRTRDYILTCDRDEHIRVSRGLPQAHITETYCLGHTQFVSKMCLTKSNLLVSGGGDDFLCVWDWVKGELLSRIDLKQFVSEFRLDEDSHENEEYFNIAVSGLWALPPGSNAPATSFLCALEGIPEILQFTDSPRAAKEKALFTPVASKVEGKEDRHFYKSCIQLHGNLLDVAVSGDVVLLSLDTLYRAGSTLLEHRNENREAKHDDLKGNRLQAYYLSDGWMKPKHTHGSYDRLLISLVDQGVKIKDDDAEIMQAGNLLYGIESLRKRGKEDFED